MLTWLLPFLKLNIQSYKNNSCICLVMDWNNLKQILKKVWYFIWEDDSIWSWIVNIILAFLLVKFVIYPLLGLLLGTGFPVVAVVSGSMEHNGVQFDNWWESNKGFYTGIGIAKDEFSKYIFKNGFNKGDIIVLLGVEPKNINRGMVIVYSTTQYKYPIIHRVIDTENTDGKIMIETKGDNNPTQDRDLVSEEQVLGRAAIKIPYLGWIKIMFTKLTGTFKELIGGG